MPFRMFANPGVTPGLDSRIALSLRDLGPQDLAGLMASTGLARESVADALAQLEDLEVVSRDAGDGGPGQPVFHYLGAQRVVAGLDIGPHTVRRVLCDLDGHVLFRDCHPRDAQEEAVNRPDALAACVRADLSSAGVDFSSLWAVTLGVPARIGADGRILESPLVPSWSGVDLAARLSETLDCAVHVANDVTLAAIAEAALGLGSLASDFLTVQVGRRLGVRQVLGGRPYEGVNRTAGSVAHLFGDRIERDGTIAWSSEADGDRVLDRALAGDAEAVAEVDDVVDGLAGGIARTVLMTNPETVVVGGQIGSRLGPWLPRLTERVERQMRGAESQVNLRCSRLGADETVAGACLFALEHATSALLGEAVWAPLPDAWATPGR